MAAEDGELVRREMRENRGESASYIELSLLVKLVKRVLVS
jgi:hypothetical protein